jgi:hypothetical protein
MEQKIEYAMLATAADAQQTGILLIDRCPGILLLCDLRAPVPASDGITYSSINSRWIQVAAC